MMGHKICFYEEIWIIIPKLSLLLLLIWSTVRVKLFAYKNFYAKYNKSENIHQNLLKVEMDSSQLGWTKSAGQKRIKRMATMIFA